MEAAESANLAIAAKYSKDRKVGEGTYAVVYLGELFSCKVMVPAQMIVSHDRARNIDGEKDSYQEGTPQSFRYSVRSSSLLLPTALATWFRSK